MGDTHESRPLLDQDENSSTSPQANGNALQIDAERDQKIGPKKLGVVLCILATELCERLSYYSVLANLILFCTSVLDFSSNDAATVSLVFSGTTYLMPIIGGYIADAYIGMYNAIYGFAMIYLLGLFLLPCSAADYTAIFGNDKYALSVTGRRTFYLMGLAFVCIGTGGIKANVGPFGALQVQDVGPKAVQTFFNWFYWFVNAGALLAYIAVAGVQQNISFAIGYIIPFFSMLLAIVFLLSGRKQYHHSAHKGSRMADSFIICWQACRKSSKKVPRATGFFDTARENFGGTYSSDMVDGVISVVRLFPIFFFVIMYWAVYSQMQATFFLQGERMDLSIGTTQVPVAMLNVFNTIAIMLLIPVLDRVIYPCFHRFGRPLSHLHRIGIGFILAALSMIVAAVVEIERKENLGFQQTVGEETFEASNITVFLQIPQFALIGASETFTSISGLEFAFTQSPASMRGVMMGVFLATNGLGNYLASLILKIVNAATTDDPWFPDEINDGHADYLFYLMSVLMGIFFLGFLVAAKFYKYRQQEEEEGMEQEETVGEEENPLERTDISTGF